jgi:hypothetical protein
LAHTPLQRATAQKDKHLEPAQPAIAGKRLTRLDQPAWKEPKKIRQLSDNPDKKQEQRQ